MRERARAHTHTRTHSNAYRIISEAEAKAAAAITADSPNLDASKVLITGISFGKSGLRQSSDEVDDETKVYARNQEIERQRLLDLKEKAERAEERRVAAESHAQRPIH